MNERFDVIVVGAGPAGSMAARACAMRGMSVLLVDKATFPRWKVCGCCVSGAAEQALEIAGLGHILNSVSATPMRRFQVSHGLRVAEIALSRGSIVSRAAFDAALIAEAQAAGVKFRQGTTALHSDVNRFGRAVTFRTGGGSWVAQSSVVLAADGLSGRFGADESGFVRKEKRASRIGLGATLEFESVDVAPGVVRMACARGGYVGIVRLENGQIDVAAAVAPNCMRREGGPAAMVSRILERNGVRANVRWSEVRFRGTGRLTGARKTPAAHRVFSIGDSAGYLEPFTGEGIGWALASGVAVAGVAHRACDRWDDRLIEEWRDSYRAIVVARRSACFVSAAALRCGWLSRAMTNVLSIAPGLAAPMLTQINRVHPSLKRLAWGA